MLSFDTKEEALRLNPSLEDYFLARSGTRRALWSCKEETMERFLASLSNELI